MNKICINIIAIGIAMAFSFLITTGAYWLVTWIFGIPFSIKIAVIIGITTNIIGALTEGKKLNKN